MVKRISLARSLVGCLVSRLVGSQQLQENPLITLGVVEGLQENRVLLHTLFSQKLRIGKCDKGQLPSVGLFHFLCMNELFFWQQSPVLGTVTLLY